MKDTVIGLMILAGCGGGGSTGLPFTAEPIIEGPPAATEGTFSGGFSFGTSSETIVGDMEMLVTFDTGVVSGSSSNMVANGTWAIDGGWPIEGTVSEASMSGMFNDNTVHTSLVGTLEGEALDGTISGNWSSPDGSYEITGDYNLTEE